jgi:hypothetical protein
MDIAPHCVHFPQENLTNALIGLNNSETFGGRSRAPAANKGLK